MARIQPNREEALDVHAEMISQMARKVRWFLNARNSSRNRGRKISLSSVSMAATGDHTLINRAIKGAEKGTSITLFKYCQVLAYIKKYDPRGHLPGIDDDETDEVSTVDQPAIAAEIAARQAELDALRSAL